MQILSVAASFRVSSTRSAAMRVAHSPDAPAGTVPLLRLRTFALFALEEMIASFVAGNNEHRVVKYRPLFRLG